MYMYMYVLNMYAGAQIHTPGCSGRPSALATHGWLTSRRLLRYILRLRSQRLGCMPVCVYSLSLSLSLSLCTACVCVRACVRACLCVCTASGDAWTCAGYGRLCRRAVVCYICIASESVDQPNQHPIYIGYIHRIYHVSYIFTLYNRWDTQV
jgi:hypothetical protein